MPGETRKTRKIYDRLHSATAYDWEEEKNKYKDIQDDGTMTFFWRAHTLTVLAIFSCILVYVAIFEVPSSDSEYNMKRGITAMVLAFLLFGVTQTPDGPFRRPHPAFWRFILCLSIVYELALVYLLFQTVDDARKVLTNFDKTLGKPIPEKNFGGNCLIYDVNNTEDPWHNVWDKMDGFVPVHFFGWWLKTLIIRDWWFCMVISLMFEMLEYTFEHSMANFNECWWDHWIMDALVCNGLGIYLGLKTLSYLSIKPYHWRGMWNIPTYRGKMKRLVLQFTPYSWTDFNWRPTSSLLRWFGCLFFMSGFLLAEMNLFFLKFVLWIPPDNYLCLTRLVFFLFMGAAAMREGFQYLDDPKCKKFGRQSWIICSIIITEFLISVKFGWESIGKPLPMWISVFWILGFIGLVLYTIWKFYIKRDVKNDIVPEKKRRVSYDIADVSEESEEEKDDISPGQYRLRQRSVNNNSKDSVHYRSKTKNSY